MADKQAIEIEPQDLLDLLAAYGAEVMARVQQGEIEKLGELTASAHEELKKLLHKLGYRQPPELMSDEEVKCIMDRFGASDPYEGLRQPHLSQAAVKKESI